MLERSISFEKSLDNLPMTGTLLSQISLQIHVIMMMLSILTKGQGINFLL